MDLVVEGKAQPLDLFVERQAQLVAGLMADGLAIVVLEHGEDAAQHADDEQRQRGDPQRMLGRGTRAGGDHALRLIDRPPEQARDEQLQRRRDEGRDDGDRHLPGVAQRHPGNAQQRAEALAPRCFGDMGKRLAALRRAAGCILAQGNIQTISGTSRNERGRTQFERRAWRHVTRCRLGGSRGQWSRCALGLAIPSSRETFALILERSGQRFCRSDRGFGLRAVGHMLPVYALGPDSGWSRMRIIVYGLGAVGGVIAAQLSLFRMPGHRHCPRQAARSRARLGADAFHPASHEDGEVCRLRRSRGNLLRGRRCRPFDDEGSGHGRRAAAAQGRRSAGAADILLSKRGCQRSRSRFASSKMSTAQRSCCLPTTTRPARSRHILRPRSAPSTSAAIRREATRQSRICAGPSGHPALSRSRETMS